MFIQRVRKGISELDKRWNKLIFLCNTEESFSFAEVEEDYKELNINLIISERLMHIPINKYPLEIKKTLRNVLDTNEKIFLFNHIEILFSPELKINPIRLFESLSKQYKLIIIWPGDYVNRTLYYAEQGYPEYFSCNDFEGEVIEK